MMAVPGTFPILSSDAPQFCRINPARLVVHMFVAGWAAAMTVFVTTNNNGVSRWES